MIGWIIAIAIGLCLLAVGLGLGIHQHFWITSGRITKGEVVELVPRRGSKGGTLYAPRVRYRTDLGAMQEFVSSTSSRPPSYEVGETVDVIYRPGAPDDAGIFSFGHRYGAAYCLTLAGLTTLFVCAGFLLGPSVLQRIYLR